MLAQAIGAETGGGSITNVAPTTESFANLGANRNVNSADEFSGTVKDTNQERDIVAVQLVASGAASFTSTYTVPASSLSAGSPGAYEAATTGPGQWRVWNPSPSTVNGLLSFQFTYTYSATGSYTFRLGVRDEGAVVSTLANTPDIVVEVVAPFTLLGIADGTGAIVGGNWGAWSAVPGSSSIEATNYVAVKNTGHVATTSVTINFAGDSFVGGTDSSATIAIDTNIQFACAETVSAAPSTLTYTYGTSSPTGSTTPAFTGLNKILYCKYQIVSIPATLFDQLYTATFSVV